MTRVRPPRPRSERNHCASDDIPHFRQHRCIRCGIEVWDAKSACRDCVAVDAALIRRWKEQ